MCWNKQTSWWMLDETVQYIAFLQSPKRRLHKCASVFHRIWRARKMGSYIRNVVSIDYSRQGPKRKNFPPRLYWIWMAAGVIDGGIGWKYTSVLWRTKRSTIQLVFHKCYKTDLQLETRVNNQRSFCKKKWWVDLLNDRYWAWMEGK